MGHYFLDILYSKMGHNLLDTQYENMNFMKITKAAAILHNIALEWHDPPPGDNHPNLEEDPVIPLVAPPSPEQEFEDNVDLQRQRAQRLRDMYRELLNPDATEQERRKMARHRATVAKIRRRRRPR